MLHFQTTMLMARSCNLQGENTFCVPKLKLGKWGKILGADADDKDNDDDGKVYVLQRENTLCVSQWGRIESGGGPQSIYWTMLHPCYLSWSTTALFIAMLQCSLRDA